MTAPAQEALERAHRALDSYALIGDGDYTPQDAYGHRCAEDVIALANRVGVLEKFLAEVRDGKHSIPGLLAQIDRLLA